MTKSEKLLRNRYGADEIHLGTEELAQVLRYKNSNSVHAAVARGTFPVKTHMVGGHRVAYLVDVAEYLDKQAKKAK